MSDLFNGVTLILMFPAIGAMFLALLPGYRYSARINMLVSFLTLLAALSLFARHGPPGTYFLIDDLNIVFIVLNTFVGFTTSVFSASYRPRAGNWPPDAEQSAFLSRHISGDDVRHEPGVDRQQYRPDVGGDRTGDAGDRGHGGPLSHA